MKYRVVLKDGKLRCSLVRCGSRITMYQTAGEKGPFPVVYDREQGSVSEAKRIMARGEV